MEQASGINEKLSVLLEKIDYILGSRDKNVCIGQDLELVTHGRYGPIKSPYHSYQ